MKNIDVDFKKQDGIVPVIIQDHLSLEILMLGYMNNEAFDLTVKTGIVHYWSRSKNRIWKKGESSGHTQEVKEIRIDCDNDTLLIKIHQVGDAACHTGYRSCFYNIITSEGLVVDGVKIFDPAKVYKEN